jgi:hypothetical protein
MGRHPKPFTNPEVAALFAAELLIGRRRPNLNDKGFIAAPKAN